MFTVLRKKIEKVARSKGIQQCIAEGIFTNQANNNNVLNLSGAVYGFCVRLNEQEYNAVFLEAQQKKTIRLKNIQDWKPIKDDIYPLYWGKDKYLGSRIHLHLKNPKGKSGLLRLCAYSSLHNKEIACVTLTVTKNADLETALRKKHPDLLITTMIIL